MKVQKKIVLIAVIILLVGGAFLFWQSDVLYDQEKSELVIGNGIFSDYSYTVYDDYVELLEYKGNEKDITIPETLLGKPVTVIGEECFAETEIETIYLSVHIQEIGENAFRYCDYLKSVEGDAEIRVVDSSAFNGCDNLQTVKMGNSINRIEKFAFSNCKALETIGEQPQLGYVGDSAFENCGELKELQITDKVVLGDSVFYGSKWLANQTDEFVILGDGSLVAYNGNSETISIPHGVTKVDTGIFEDFTNVENIKEIIIPQSVHELVTGCFIYCSGITVYIPDSVIVIDESHQELAPKDETNGLTFGGNDGFLTIVTTAGSTAQAYAEKYGIKCEIVEGW